MASPEILARTALMLLLLLPSGCSNHNRPLLGLNASQRTLVGRSVDQLREAFNRGNCQTIYDEADPVFRLAQLPPEWLAQCEHIRNTLGTWRSFDLQMHGKLGIPLTVIAGGPAVFATGDYQVKTTWHLNGGRAQLFSLLLNGGGQQIKIPPTPLQPSRVHSWSGLMASIKS